MYLLSNKNKNIKQKLTIDRYRITDALKTIILSAIWQLTSFIKFNLPRQLIINYLYHDIKNSKSKPEEKHLHGATTLWTYRQYYSNVGMLNMKQI